MQKQIMLKQKITKNCAYYLEYAHEENQKQNKEVKIWVEKQLTEFQSKYLKMDNILKILNNSQVIAENVNEEAQKNANKRFDYEQIQEETCKQENECRAFAFNKDDTILFVASSNLINVYNFSQRKFLKMNELKEHTSYIFHLRFMNESNSLVSSDLQQVFIWISPPSHSNYNWIVKQRLELLDSWNFSGSGCIVISEFENYIITGHQFLSFWKKYKMVWDLDEYKQFHQQICDISLNKCENKLLLLVGENNLFEIYIYNKIEEWSFQQKFQCFQTSFRIAFTVGNQFVFSNGNHDYLEVFDYNEQENEFKQVQNLKIQVPYQEKCRYCFPCQFISPLKILTYKYGKRINIIKVNKANDYELIQSIKMGSYENYGRMSNDGRYLVTWDNNSREMQRFLLR